MKKKFLGRRNNLIPSWKKPLDWNTGKACRVLCQLKEPSGAPMPTEQFQAGQINIESLQRVGDFRFSKEGKRMHL